MLPETYSPDRPTAYTRAKWVVQEKAGKAVQAAKWLKYTTYSKASNIFNSVIGKAVSFVRSKESQALYEKRAALLDVIYGTCFAAAGKAFSRSVLAQVVSEREKITFFKKLLAMDPDTLRGFSFVDTGNRSFFEEFRVARLKAIEAEHDLCELDAQYKRVIVIYQLEV